MASNGVPTLPPTDAFCVTFPSLLQCEQKLQEWMMAVESNAAPDDVTRLRTGLIVEERKNMQHVLEQLFLSMEHDADRTATRCIVDIIKHSCDTSTPLNVPPSLLERLWNFAAIKQRAAEGTDAIITTLIRYARVTNSAHLLACINTTRNQVTEELQRIFPNRAIGATSSASASSSASAAASSSSASSIDFAACFSLASAASAIASFCHTHTHANNPPSQSLVEAAAMQVNQETLVIVKEDLDGVIRLAKVFVDSNGADESSVLSTSLSNLVIDLFNPTKLNSWLFTAARTESWRVIPRACIATWLVPVYEQIATWFDNDNETTSSWTESLITTLENTYLPSDTPRAASATGAGSKRSPAKSPMSSSSTSALSLSHSNTLSHTPPECVCATQKHVLRSLQGKMMFPERRDYVRHTVTCLAMESLSLLLHIRSTLLDPKKTKRLTPLEMEELPESLKLYEKDAIPPYILRQQFSLFTSSIRTMHDRLVQDSTDEFSSPSWCTLDTARECVGRLMRWVKDATTASTNNNPAAASSTTLAALPSPSKPLAPRVMKNLPRLLSTTMELLQLLSPESNLASIPLHTHTLPWLTLARAGIKELSPFGDNALYTRSFLLPLKRNLLGLLHTMLMVVVNHSQLPAIDAMEDVESTTPSNLILPLATLFWHELQFTRFDRKASYESRCGLLMDYLGCLEILVPKRHEEGKSAKASGIRADRTKVCIVLTNALSEWAIKPLPLFTRVHQFLLERMELLPPHSIDGESRNDSMHIDAPLDTSSDPSANSIFLPSLENDSYALHLSESSLILGLDAVKDAIQDYDPMLIPEAGREERKEAEDDPQNERDEDEDDEAFSQPEPSLFTPPALPTWLPPRSETGPSPYSAADDVTSSANVDDPEFHPSQVEARRANRKKRFDEQVAAPFALLKTHTLWLRELLAQSSRTSSQRSREITDFISSSDSAQRKQLVSQRQQAERADSHERTRFKNARINALATYQRQLSNCGWKGLELKAKAQALVDRDFRFEESSESAAMDLGEDGGREEEFKQSPAPTMLSSSTSSSSSDLPSAPAAAAVRSPLSAVPARPSLPETLLSATGDVVSFVANMILGLMIERPTGPEDPDVDRMEMRTEESKQQEKEEPPTERLSWSALLSLLPRSLHQSRDAKRSKVVGGSSFSNGVSANTSDPLSHRSAREIVSHILKAVDACMDATEKDVKVLLAAWQLHMRPISSSVDVNGSGSSPFPTAAAAASSPLPIPLATSSYPFFHTPLQQHLTTFTTLQKLHALYEEDSEDAFSAMVLGINATVQEWRSLPSSPITNDEWVSIIHSDLTAIEQLLGPYLKNATKHVTELRRARRKRHRTSLVRGTADDGVDGDAVDEAHDSLDDVLSTKMESSVPSAPRTPSKSGRRFRAPRGSGGGSGRSRGSGGSSRLVSKLNSRPESRIVQAFCVHDSRLRDSDDDGEPYEDLETFIVDDSVQD